MIQERRIQNEGIRFTIVSMAYDTVSERIGQKYGQKSG